jgi:hypothetical protein
VTEGDVSRVRRCRPQALDAAGRRVEQRRSEVQSLIALLLRHRPVGRAWTGAAATAAADRSVSATGALEHLAECLAATATALGHAGLRLQAAQDLVTRADERAADDGAWLDEAGRLFLPVRATLGDPVEHAHQARRDALLSDEVTAYLRQAVRLAVRTDAELAGDLVAAARGGGAAAGVLAARGVLELPPPPAVRADAAGAFASAGWWRGLTDAERAKAIREHPSWVGPRDGLPASARHAANLVLLTEAEGAAKERVRAAGGRAPTPFAIDELALARQQVADLRAVRDVVSRRDGVERRLLLVDTGQRDVRAVVALGDVEGAAHVATYVAGMSTTPRDDLRRYDATFRRMRDEARALARGGDVAIVTWLGYDPPQAHETVESIDRNVLSGKVARDNADALAAFLTGLGAARDRAVHQTLWAHSYGSVLAGYALLRTSAVDDVAVFGSPGVPFDRIEQTGLKPGSFNVLGAAGDAVAGLGWLVHGTKAASVAGATALSTTGFRDASTACNRWHGVDSDVVDPDRTSRGHSEYLRQGSVSERNLVAVAAGRPELRVLRTMREQQCLTGHAGPVG